MNNRHSKESSAANSAELDAAGRAASESATELNDPISRAIAFLRARLRILVRVSVALLAVLVLADAIPGIVNKEHAHTPAEHFPGFWAVFGFIGCVVIILGSKAFGHAGIMQREDYYDE